MYKTSIMGNFIDNLDIKHLQDIISDSTSVSEVLRKLDKADRGANHTLLVKFLREHPEINTETLVGRRIQRVSRKGIPLQKLSEILIENGSGNSNKIKQRLIKEGVKEKKCELCNNTEWLGMPIPLDLHHINGNHFDNRLENLIILCPTCHRLSENWGSKNSSIDLIMKNIAEQTAEDKMKLLQAREEQRQKEIIENKLRRGEIRKTPIKEKEQKFCLQCGKEIIGRGTKYCSKQCANIAAQKSNITKNEILEASQHTKSMIQLGKRFNMTDNAIRKWLKKYDILNEVKENFKKI